jgi:4-oxalocrotonate tautomerase
MPFVEVKLMTGYTPEQLNRVIRGVSDVVMEALDMPPEKVRVVIVEVPRRLWAVGGVSYQDAAISPSE